MSPADKVKQLGKDTLIPVGLAIVLAMAAVGGAWSVSARVTSVEQRLMSQRDAIQRIEADQRETIEAMRRDIRFLREAMVRVEERMGTGANQ